MCDGKYTHCKWERVDTHFTLLQRLIQQGARQQAKNGEALSDHKEVLALAAAINFMSIAPLSGAAGQVGEGRRGRKNKECVFYWENSIDWFALIFALFSKIIKNVLDNHTLKHRN